MPQIDIYQVDAFTNRAFGGNSAAVCPLAAFLDDDTLRVIARENNLSETAYLVERDSDERAPVYDLRWFTPTVEVDLCGHATLASAHVVMTHLRPNAAEVQFLTRSGPLSVVREGSQYAMDFPVLDPKPYELPKGLAEAMGATPATIWKSDVGDRDLLLVFDNAGIIEGLAPDLAALKAFAPYGFIATAPGDDGVDFVTRCFFPNHGIPEDPVTGSAYCVAGPYWARELGRTSLHAVQLSERRGEIWLEVGTERVRIIGSAVEVMRGALFLS